MAAMILGELSMLTKEEGSPKINRGLCLAKFVPALISVQPVPQSTPPCNIVSIPKSGTHNLYTKCSMPF